MMPQIRYPSSVPYSVVEVDVDSYIDAVFDSLQSSFFLLPRGPGFVAYREFQRAYEALKRHTAAFGVFEPETVMEALREEALAFVVLRTMLGFTPPELAHTASRTSGIAVSQNFARTLDRQVRTASDAIESLAPQSRTRVDAMVAVACRLLKEGVGDVPEDMIHRLDKVDTRSGLAGLKYLAADGVPYAVLLYERFLGRPFASHRDAVSGIVGNVMEDAVEAQLRKAGISFRRTKRAGRIKGFDQAPDFTIPDELNPQIVIEAKITEDDGTARDKVTRIQHLAEISDRRRSEGQPGFKVIACIEGRGFAVRRAEMGKLLAATRGKVFTLRTLDYLVEHTELERYRSID